MEDKNCKGDVFVNDCDSYEVSRGRARIIREALTHWKDSGLVSVEQYQRLNGSLKEVFDWKRIIFHFTWIAGSCFLISIAALFCNEFIIELLKMAPPEVKTVSSLFFGTVLITAGFLLRRKAPLHLKTYAILLLLGCVFVGLGLGYLGKVFNFSRENIRYLLLSGCFIYGLIGWFGKSGMVWLFALVSFSSWLGCESGASFGTYWLGVSEPLRFLVLGSILVILAFWTGTGRFLEKREINGVTLAYGLLTLFVSLWFLSLFGVYSLSEDFRCCGKTSDTELFIWSAVMAGVALMTLWEGVKHDRSMLIGFGSAFLGIELYTKYFEYFWDSMDKSLFFFILGVSLLVVIAEIHRFKIKKAHSE